MWKEPLFPFGDSSSNTPHQPTINFLNIFSTSSISNEKFGKAWSSLVWPLTQKILSEFLADELPRSYQKICLLSNDISSETIIEEPCTTRGPGSSSGLSTPAVFFSSLIHMLFVQRSEQLSWIWLYFGWACPMVLQYCTSFFILPCGLAYYFCCYNVINWLRLINWTESAVTC